MPAVFLRFEATWDTDALGAAAQRGVENAMPAVAEALRLAADDCFELERDPWGNPWAELAPATVNERKRKNKVGKILQRDGVLRRSVHGYPTEPIPGVTNAYVAAGGPAAAYASLQQFGDEHVPARPYFPMDPEGEPLLPDELRTEIVETIKDSILIEMRKAREAP